MVGIYSPFSIFIVLKRNKMEEKKEKLTSCIRCGDRYKCPVCQSEHLVKNGKTKTGKQRYSCKKCNKQFIVNYTYNACASNTNQQIILFTKEGLGIRSTARVLKISVTTLLKRIISIAKSIEQPPIVKGKTYEVDEMRTFIGKKSLLCWIVYALDREKRFVLAGVWWCLWLC